MTKPTRALTARSARPTAAAAICEIYNHVVVIELLIPENLD